MTKRSNRLRFRCRTSFTGALPRSGCRTGRRLDFLPVTPNMLCLVDGSCSGLNMTSGTGRRSITILVTSLMNNYRRTKSIMPERSNRLRFNFRTSGTLPLFCSCCRTVCCLSDCPVAPIMTERFIDCRCSGFNMTSGTGCRGMAVGLTRCLDDSGCAESIMSILFYCLCLCISASSTGMLFRSVCRTGRVRNNCPTSPIMTERFIDCRCSGFNMTSGTGCRSMAVSQTSGLNNSGRAKSIMTKLIYRLCLGISASAAGTLFQSVSRTSWTRNGVPASHVMSEYRSRSRLRNSAAGTGTLLASRYRTGCSLGGRPAAITVSRYGYRRRLDF